MRPAITSNVAQVLRRMQARPAAVVRELTRAAPDIARDVERVDKQILQEDIYNVPIPLLASADRATDLSRVPVQLRAYVLSRRKFQKPLSQAAKVRGKTTKGKYGKWQRSGNLKRLEKVRAEGPHVVLTNNADYAVARYKLGTAGGRKIKSPGVKSVQWQAEAVSRQMEQIRRRRREAVLKALWQA